MAVKEFEKVIGENGSLAVEGGSRTTDIKLEVQEFEWTADGGQIVVKFPDGSTQPHGTAKTPAEVLKSGTKVAFDKKNRTVSITEVT